jgi:UDP-GlcNAc:undecaprenyl-phosphate GlcNAc-1-phosphate transferase
VYPVLGFAVALSLTVVMIPLLMRFAPAMRLLDQPGGRKVHELAIPRSGGLAIAFGFFIATVFWLSWDRQTLALVAGSIVIVIFGLQDDRNDINYKWKFFGQIIAVLLLMAGGVLIERLPFADIDVVLPWVSYPLTFLFLLGAINAVNLSDGLDGLAAGIVLLSLSLIAVFAYQSGQATVSFLSLAMIGGLVGFLRYNTHPARVFMGDTGSQFVGLVTASLAVIVTQSDQCAFSPLLPLLILGLPILDTATVIVIRLHKGRSPFYADKNHIHHQLMTTGMWHYEAVAVIYLLQIALVVMAYLLRYQMDSLIALCYGVFAVVIVGLLYIAQLKQLTVRDHAAAASGATRRNLLLRRVDCYYHHSTYVLQAMLALFFLLAFVSIEGISPGDIEFTFWVSGGLAAVAIVLRRYPQWSSRITGYLASVTVVYLLAVADIEPYSHWYVDGYLMAMVALLALAIRMTRKTEFRLDTGDLLVLFLVIVIPQLPVASIDEISLGRFALRLAVLLYTCEYLISKNNIVHWLFSGSAIAGVFLIGFLA